MTMNFEEIKKDIDAHQKKREEFEKHMIPERERLHKALGKILQEEIKRVGVGQRNFAAMIREGQGTISNILYFKKNRKPRLSVILNVVRKAKELPPIEEIVNQMKQKSKDHNHEQ